MARHAVRITQPDPQHVLTVGNRDFAYTADITGMKTFTGYHDVDAGLLRGEVAVNTDTVASWGWDQIPNPEGHQPEGGTSHSNAAPARVSAI